MLKVKIYTYLHEKGAHRIFKLNQNQMVKITDGIVHLTACVLVRFYLVCNSRTG